jgi:hypothetical protein
MNALTIAELSAKPRYVRSRGRPRGRGCRGINYSSVRYFPSAQSFATALRADGWNVTIERRRDITAGVKSGRVYVKDPEDFFWTYFRAEKDGHVFVRDTSGYRLGWLFEKILEHYGYAINRETGRYELESDQ